MKHAISLKLCMNTEPTTNQILYASKNWELKKCEILMFRIEVDDAFPNQIVFRHPIMNNPSY